MEEELEETLKKRHEKIIYFINEIWKLEREKYVMRSDLESIRGDITSGLKGNGTLNKNKEDRAAAANILVSRKEELCEKENLEVLIKKQHGLLSEIEKIISI